MDFASGRLDIGDVLIAPVGDAMVVNLAGAADLSAACTNITLRLGAAFGNVICSCGDWLT